MSTYNAIKYDFTPPAGTFGDMTLISEQTASASSSISFTGIDSTYRTYCFKFINMHPSNDNVSFHFQGSTNGGSSYGVTITSTLFDAQHDEADSATFLGYLTSLDLAQSTSYQSLCAGLGNANDESCSGELFLFDPSSTTFVKHFIAKMNRVNHNDYSINTYIAGYFNTTSAINAINFKMASGNIDAGTIQMNGIA